MKKMTPVSSDPAKPVEAPEETPAPVEETTPEVKEPAVPRGIAPDYQNTDVPANDWDWSQLARPPFILSWVDDEHPNGGFVIGWDTCGACSLHIRTCVCKNGPEQPLYVKRWRRKDDTKHDKPATVSKKAVVTADPDEVAAKVAEATGPEEGYTKEGEKIGRKKRADAGKPRGPRTKGTADSVQEAADDLSTAMTKG